MAFSFGSPAPANSSGGFSFGSPAPGGFGTPAPGGFGAPAPSGGFGTPAPAGGFGAPAPTPGGFGAPAPGGFGAPAPGGFGAPAPAPGGFGAPAPAPGGFSFGSPAPAPGGFGAPAPGGFGAPAPGGFSFGSPAPTGGFGGFGSPPAPAPGGFQQQQQPQQPQQQQQQPQITGSTPYSQLPDHYKQAIDRLHEVIVTHKRTVAQVSGMAPKALVDPSSIGNAAENKDISSFRAGSSSSKGGISNMLLLQSTNLSVTLDSRGSKSRADHSDISRKIQACHNQLQKLQELQATLEADISVQHERASDTVEKSYLYAKWPVEAVAVRRGVRLGNANKNNNNSSEEKKDAGAAEEVARIVRDALNMQVAYVDRVENLPSPYLLQQLAQFDQEYQLVQSQITMIKQRLQDLRENAHEPFDVQGVAELQDAQIQKLVTRQLEPLQQSMDQLRQHYHRWEFEPRNDVLYNAKIADMHKQQHANAQLQRMFLQEGGNTNTATSNNAPAPVPGNAAPAPFSFASPTPAPGGFGAPAPGGFGTPAPAPSSGGSFSFGGTPAPAPAGGFNFGGAPAPAAPAPAGGFNFGGSAAPAPAGGFGAPAPAGGGFSFGGTSAPASSGSSSSQPKKKLGSRSTSRGRR